MWRSGFSIKLFIFAGLVSIAPGDRVVVVSPVLSKVFRGRQEYGHAFLLT